MGKIVFETNRYAQEQPTTGSPYTRFNSWKVTCIEEMYFFLAVNMLMARNKKLNIHEY